MERELLYAEELRTKPRNTLTRSERAQLDEEDKWAAAHRVDVARLDAFVGKRVALRREMHTIGGKVVLAGMAFRVLMRTRDRLVALDHLDEAWLLRDDWVRAVPERKPEVV